MQANSNNSSQTNISSLCRHSLMINQISKDIYIHLNSRELRARHVNSRSTIQCNATSRFRCTVSFGINVQDTIKYLPFGMCGPETESVTDATLLFYKDKEETLQIYYRKVLYMVLRLNVVIISCTLDMLLEQKNSCSGLKKYIIPSSKDQFQH